MRRLGLLGIRAHGLSTGTAKTCTITTTRNVMSVNPTVAAARLRVGGVRDGVLVMAIAGRLDSSTTGKIWRQATEAVVASEKPGA